MPTNQNFEIVEVECGDLKQSEPINWKDIEQNSPSLIIEDARGKNRMLLDFFVKLLTICGLKLPENKKVVSLSIYPNSKGYLTIVLYFDNDWTSTETWICLLEKGKPVFTRRKDM